jgi:hypothetical protein
MPLAGVVFFVVLSFVARSAAWQGDGHHHQPSEVGVVFVIKYSSWAELYIEHIYMKCRAWE